MRTDENALKTFKAVVEEIDRLAERHTVSIMDVGCGDGQLLDMLNTSGYRRLTGVGAIVRVPGEAKVVDNIDLCERNWSEKVGGRKFDIIVATDVIEHLTNPHQFLIESRKLINDGGWLILSTPNVHNLRSIFAYALSGRFSGFFGPNFNDGHPLYDQHIFIPNRHLIEYFTRLVGFRLDRVRYIHGMGRLFSQTTMYIAAPELAG